MMSVNNILVINASLYTFTCLVSFIKSKSLQGGTLLLLLFVISSWSSLLFYNSEWFYLHFASESKITLWPFIYLYLVIMLLIIPLLKFNDIGILYINEPNKKKLRHIAISLTIINFIDIILQLPNLNIAQSNVTLGMIRDSTYDNPDIYWFQSYGVLRQFHMVATGFRPISLIISTYMYFCYPINRKLGKYFFLITILLIVVSQLVFINRGQLLMYLIFLLTLYFCFRHLISKGKKYTLRKIALVLIVPFTMFFISVTQSRFSNAVEYSLYRYAGESMLNFNGSLYYKLKDNTWGTAYFPLVANVFQTKSIKLKTQVEKWDYMEKKTGVRSQFFYTIVGALLFEFGVIVTFILAIAWCFFGCVYLRNKNGTVSFSMILLYTIIAFMLINGVFNFIYQGVSGNLTIIFTIFLLVYLKQTKSKKITYTRTLSY